jgi:predicted transcriptional regulator
VHGPLTVKQVHAKIEAYRLIAYSTILTVSARMEEKGLIARHTTGADYNGARLLTPTVTPVELLTQAMVAVCDNLNTSADDRAAVVAVLGNADEQATLETALSWLGLGIVVLLVVLIPVIALAPTLRLATGVVLLLVGLFA